MPKRILALAFALGALALAACNNGNINNLYGSATPTPGATATITPNPSASTAVVNVSYSASPLPNQPVQLSTPDAQGHITNSVIATQNTNAAGQATFNGLTAGTTYCFSSTYQPPTTPAPLPRTISQCTNLWGNANYGINFAF